MHHEGADLEPLLLTVAERLGAPVVKPLLGKAIVFACVVVFLQFRPNGLVTFRTRGLTA